MTPDTLVDGIRAAMGDDLTRVVHVRGDTDAVYGEVVAVMDKLATNGITHIAIMTNSRNKASVSPASAVPAAAVIPATGGPGK